MVVAYVVAATFEQCHCYWHFQRVAHHRQIALEKLILERLRPGRDNDLSTRQQCRHEIGEGFAGTGTGLGH